LTCPSLAESFLCLDDCLSDCLSQICERSFIFHQLDWITCKIVFRTTCVPIKILERRVDLRLGAKTLPSYRVSGTLSGGGELS
jgi:hypothetical protein